VTAERRQLIATVVFILGLLICSLWVFRDLRAMFSPETGSGGIAGVSLGLTGILVTIVPPVLTIWLTQLSGWWLAKWWRNAHLAVTLALIVVPMAMTSMYVLIVSILVFPPVSIFFVVGAIAIWFASPGNPPSPSES
jgi:hypothetical protein